MQPASFWNCYSRKASLKRPWLAGTETACRKKLEAGSLARGSGGKPTARVGVATCIPACRQLPLAGAVGLWGLRPAAVSALASSRRPARPWTTRRDEPSATRARDGGSRETASRERPGWLGTQRGGAPARLRWPLMRRRAILWPGAPRRLGPDLSSRTRNYLIYDEINSSQIDEKTSQNIYDGFVTILINVIE